MTDEIILESTTGGILIWFVGMLTPGSEFHATPNGVRCLTHAAPDDRHCHAISGGRG